MDTPAFGRLEKEDLRTGWSHEATEFTPWLAREENVKLLGDTIGFELEVEATEKNVGPFSADLLCLNMVDDSWVLIENQLERTDHRHLGQLLTYAAGLDAVTIVWIARRFTEEHRAAMDWLNRNTQKEIHFFGIEIELWRIGDSPVAPKFNLVVKPNDWQKTVAQVSRQGGQLTETQQLQLRYWTSFSEYLQDHKTRVRPQAPRPRHWAAYALGRSGAHLTTRIYLADNRIEACMECKHPEQATAMFNALKTDREAIEREVGRALDWDEKPDVQRCEIIYSWEADPADEEDWPAQHEKLAATLDDFYRVFSPRVKAFDMDANDRAENPHSGA